MERYLKRFRTPICLFLLICLLLLSACGGYEADVSEPSAGVTETDENKPTEEQSTDAQTDLPLDPSRRVSAKLMREVYEDLKTPYKYGAVMKQDGVLCDSPSVFYHEGAWYMSFIQIDKETSGSGYESYLAKSEDLLHWEILFPIMERSDASVWDAKQCAAYAAFINNDLFGDYRIQEVNGSYYFSYLGGNLDGYETDPLMTGLCRTEDITDPSLYERFSEPILTPHDEDAREGERKTLYKSNLFIDEKQTLGYKYVNAYNAKDEDDVERIFLAVSDDGENWERYHDKYVLAEPGATITGDPQILRSGDLYIMVYFVLKDGVTYNTFAASYDLVHWTRWLGDALISCEYEWENVFAHKSALVRHNGVLYHYYCAVNSKGERFIAVAASEPVWQ